MRKDKRFWLISVYEEALGNGEIVRVRRNVQRGERGGSLEIGFEECEQSILC